MCWAGCLNAVHLFAHPCLRCKSAPVHERLPVCGVYRCWRPCECVGVCDGVSGRLADSQFPWLPLPLLRVPCVVSLRTPGLCRHQCIVRTACRSEPGGHGVYHGGDASVATSRRESVVHPSAGSPTPAAPQDPTPFCTLQGSGPQEPQAVAVAIAPFPDSR